MIKEDIIDVDVDSTQAFLSGVGIFLDLESEIIEGMAERMALFRYEKGEHLIHKGSAGEYMLLIKRGKIFVVLDDQNIFLKKGNVVGEMALLSGHPSKADVIADEETEAFVLYRDDFQQLMKKYNSLASTMTLLLKSRLTGSGEIQELGKYKILGQLGEGGMAYVYDAYDPDLERDVAIKALKYEVATAEFKQRFRQEAKTIARLKHPHIMHVIEVIEDYATNFIVMEKLEGSDLSNYMKRHGVFSSGHACEILYQVASALQYANDEANGGIIHRDVKPANIFIDGNDRVTLTDFGIASTKDDKSVSYEGTVLYMAPELLEEKTIDHRVDIYALGITAYAMLAGKTPFRGATIADVVALHINSEPAAIENYVPDISSGLSEFIQRALIKDPEKRISDWDEILSLLESGKKTDIKRALGSSKDMAIVIKIKSGGVVPVELLSELEKTLNEQRVDYDIETVLKESLEVDINFD